MKALIVLCALTLYTCTSVEKSAYNTVIAAKAFTDKIKAQHPECGPTNFSTLCVDLGKAIGAKDILIDAIEIYCAGPAFDGGGSCIPPMKGSSAYMQANAKLDAALSLYGQAEKDLKGVIH